MVQHTAVETGSTVKNYLSLVKFSHTIFALPFALIGFCLGAFKHFGFLLSIIPSWKLSYNWEFHVTQWNLNNTIGWSNGIPIFYTWGDIIFKLLLVLICMVTARSAAMAFNRYLDRSFDAKNPRTAIREIPRGIIAPQSALRFVILNCIIFIAATYFINPICFYLSPVALFVVLFYSYTKRFTPLCHLILGLGLSLAPIGAYLAVTGQFNILPLFFSFAVICWVSGFDIIYALQDVDFDKSQKLYSIPVAVGKSRALHISELLHAVSAACVIAAGIYGHFHVIYWVGVAVFIGMLIYQHSIVKPNDLSKVNIAFMTANGIASVVFGVLVIADIFLG
ncbi:MAG TPA: UbiA-like polyprenyltransferase [Chitinophagaceae bacterium]|nr:UbiA-like polyprenyltransferase [Chitinophagaceae bacterium]